MGIATALRRPARGDIRAARRSIDPDAERARPTTLLLALLPLLPATGFALMGLLALWPTRAPWPVLAFVWATILATCGLAAYLAFFARERTARTRAGLAAAAGAAGALALEIAGTMAFWGLVALV